MITNDQIKRFYNYSDELFALLESEHKKYAPETNEVIFSITEEIKNTPEKTASTNPMVQEVSSTLHDLTSQALVLRDVFNTKFYYLYDALIYAINKENFLMLAENARALFEHIGTLAYLSFVTEKTAKTLRNTRSEKRFMIEFNTLADHFEKLFYTTPSLEHGNVVTKDNNELSATKLFTNYISKYVDKKQAKVHENDYMFLSDFVHPNFGSNLLVTSGYMAEESNIFVPDKGAIIEIILASLDRLLSTASHMEYRFILAGSTLLDMYRISLKEHENVISIFSPSLASQGKKEVFSGDGKTPKTAIHFPIARTLIEEFNLCIEYIQNNKVDRLTYKSEYVENGWKYYSYSKMNKKIWFKVDIKLDL